MNIAAAGRSAPGRWLSWWLLGALAGYLGLTWWFGGADTLDAVRRIGLPLVIAGMLLTTCTFAIRALRWHWLLRVLGHHVPPAVDAAVYLAGIGLSATPGKVGEAIRSALLVRHGVPVGTSLAAFVADRLSDLYAVVLIALLPLACSGGWSDPAVMRWIFILVAIAMAPVALGRLVRSRRWYQVGAELARLKSLRTPVQWLEHGTADFIRLWRPHVAPWSVAASVLAYGLQATTLAAMVTQVAPQVSWAISLGIFGAATLAGAASMVPGGVGAMELALVLLLQRHGVDGASALGAALCLRAVTFWFGLLLGAIGLSVATRLQRA